MKMKSIAKVSLVLGILATGVNTVTEQPVHAENKHVQVSQNSKNLKAYYTQPSVEYKNVTGYISSIQPKPGTKFLNMIEGNTVNNLALVGKDKEHYHTGVHRNLDIFYVNEDKRFEGAKYSIGGITKANRKKVDYNARIKITKEDKKGTISHDVSEYKITKEEISLKELDFKLRKQLIEQHNLYGNIGSGTIVIKMKNGGKYTFELHKKLQQHRMADVIDGTNIDRIEVNLKSS
ncbi:TPA: superantigen-like protein [Staphylococcus aureus]|nr:superantigen-like protein [Staphylococcus aureus]HEO8797382.1 superantigen-like protein [Staphylococcus aureus]